MAAGLVLAQLRAQMALPEYAAAPTLGLLYITDHYAQDAQEILDHLAAELPEITDWAGTVGVGVTASNVEYYDEPALSVMLCAVPPHKYRVFSGVAPLGVGEAMGFEPHTALVHADGTTADLADLIAEMAARTATGYLFGGLASSRTQALQFAIGGNGNIKGQGKAGGVFRGGLSGVAFGGLTARGGDAVNRSGHFGSDVLVRHIIGLDPTRNAVAIADRAEPGMRMAFCQRNVHAARADLMRICAEIREELEPQEVSLPVAAALAAPDPGAGPHPARRIAGAVYVSCAGRGGPHFGGPSAELQIVRRALGDVPLVGFFAGGEIARDHLYGYTGVLTVFC
jgi:small ligand-binding sensory domain FIST